MVVSMITSVIVTTIRFLPSRITTLWREKSCRHPKVVAVSRALLPTCNKKVSR